jgi:hypothetical protein
MHQPFMPEIMLFSNTDIPEFNFTFNGSTIPITNSYKLLGVTFSSDAKCNIQVRLRSTRDQSQFFSVIHHDWNS